MGGRGLAEVLTTPVNVSLQIQVMEEILRGPHGPTCGRMIDMEPRKRACNFVSRAELQCGQQSAGGSITHCSSLTCGCCRGRGVGHGEGLWGVTLGRGQQ